jgi:hypothetical protein
MKARYAKGSHLHLNSVEFMNKTQCSITRTAVDAMDIIQVRETFYPLHKLARPENRFVDKFLDKITFNTVPRGKVNKLKYYDSFAKIEPTDDTLHIIVGSTIHPFDQQSITRGIQTHSHGGYVAIRGGKIRLKKMFLAGRRVEDETAFSWACLRAMIKAFKTIKKDGMVKSLVIYVPNTSTIQGMVNISAKPSGRSISVAMATIFKDFTTEYPNIEINVKSFSVTQANQGYNHPFDHLCFKCNTQVVFLESDTAWFFGRSLNFPESATFNCRCKLITRSVIEDWQEEFDREGSDGYKGHGWYEFRSGGAGENRRIFPTHLNQGPWLCEYGGVMVANDPGLCGRFIRTATKHALIREYHRRFFPDEDYHCPGHLNAPETWDHILNECLWYVQRIGHQEGDIQTIPGLILFLCNNLKAFSFDQMEDLRCFERDWLVYRKLVYDQREVLNKVREKKGLLPEVGPIFVHE